MNKSSVLMERVKTLDMTSEVSVSELLYRLSETGFQGRNLGLSLRVLENMLDEPDLTILCGYAGSLSVAGQWSIICWLIENRLIDVLVPTGANISEDIVEAMGHTYYQGSDRVDDTSLFRSGINRYYNVYGKESDYIEMTELIADFILTLDNTMNYSSREFLYLFGKWLSGNGIRSIVSVAAENEVPVYCPAIIDSPFGDAAIIAKSHGFNLVIDGVKDYTEFIGLSEKIHKTGVIYIGGGVPKDFIQLLAVTGSLGFQDRKIPLRSGASRRDGINEEYYPHLYALQITTDSPQWGGLSGCSFEEAVSWGKETDNSEHIQCYCDATIALPILMYAVMENRKGSRKGYDLSWLFND